MSGNEENVAVMENVDIKDLVYVIRGQQVMLDSDLAKLYGYTVKRLNEQVKRNIERFPEDFMFQLTHEEMIEVSRSQFATSIQTIGIKGGRTYKIFAFTEQGIYMLSTVLKGDLAIEQSILIMRTFKEMRHYIAENNQLFNNQDILFMSHRLVKHEEDINQIKEYMATKEDIKVIMDKFVDVDNIKQIVILNNQQFEANDAYIEIYKKDKHSIYIVDDYINIHTLSLLTAKHKDVEVIIFSDNKGIRRNQLNELEFDNFNKEYPTISIKKNNGQCHDRFIILDYKLDTEKVYHCGASSKDAGKKVCCINQIMKSEMVYNIVDCLLTNEEYSF